MCVHVCVCLCFVVLNTEQCLVVENSHQITVHSTCYIINTKTGKCRFLFSCKSIPLSQTLCDNSALCNIHKMYFNDSAVESKTHLSSKHLMVKFIFLVSVRGRRDSSVVECQIHDQNVMGSSVGEKDARIVFSMVNFLI